MNTIKDVRESCAEIAEDCSQCYIATVIHFFFLIYQCKRKENNCGIHQSN